MERLLGYIAGQSINNAINEQEPICYLYGHEALEGEQETHEIYGKKYVGVLAPDIRAVYTPTIQKEYPFSYISVVSANLAGYDITNCTMRCFKTMFAAKTTGDNSEWQLLVDGNDCIKTSITYLTEDGCVGQNWNDFIVEPLDDTVEIAEVNGVIKEYRRTVIKGPISNSC